MKTAIGRELGNLLRRGEDALLRHDYERASAYFRRAYTAEPGNVTAITNLGFAYAKMGRFTHAQKCFITALDIDPDNQVARKNLSLLMSPEKSGRNPGTQSPCKGSSGEELFLRYLEWGNLQMEQKNYYAAIQYFRQASKIHPDFIEPYLKVGLCFEELREYGAAVGAFTDALDIFPKDPVALEHLNICRGLSGTEDERDNQGLDLFEERTAKPSPVTPSTPVRSEQVPPSGRQDSHHPAPASQGAPQVPHSPPVSSPSVPQTEDEIIQSILNQYSTLVGADSAKKDVSEVPAEPPETSSAPAVSQPSSKTQASQGSSDDIVNSILMQYQEDIADGEDQKTQTESADTHENVPHTGSAPLSGENSDMTKAQKIGIRVELSDDQKDALRELGNIGASHAATTLSTMLNTPIMLNVPEISITDFEHINDLISQENSAMGIFTMEGQMAKAGYVILHVPQESVIQMTSIMLGMPVDANRPLNEMDESAITEIGNIMVSAFLDGTAELLGIIMLPSPPRTIFDTPKNVFDLIIKESNIAYDNVVFFRTELICDEHELNLNIFMLPNPPVLQEIVRMLEKIIEDSALGQ